MKKSIIFVLLLSIMLLTAACGKQNNETISGESKQESSDNSTDDSVYISTSEIEGEKELKLTVCNSVDYLDAIHDDHFYAADEKNKIYKLYYDGDMSILSSGLEVYVRINSVKSIEFNQPVLEQWVYQYEANVEYLGLIERPY